MSGEIYRTLVRIVDDAIRESLEKHSWYVQDKIIKPSADGKTYELEKLGSGKVLNRGFFMPGDVVTVIKDTSGNNWIYSPPPNAYALQPTSTSVQYPIDMDAAGFPTFYVINDRSFEIHHITKAAGTPIVIGSATNSSSFTAFLIDKDTTYNLDSANRYDGLKFKAYSVNSAATQLTPLTYQLTWKSKNLTISGLDAAKSTFADAAASGTSGTWPCYPSGLLGTWDSSAAAASMTIGGSFTSASFIAATGTVYLKPYYNSYVATLNYTRYSAGSGSGIISGSSVIKNDIPLLTTESPASVSQFACLDFTDTDTFVSNNAGSYYLNSQLIAMSLADAAASMLGPSGILFYPSGFFSGTTQTPVAVSSTDLSLLNSTGSVFAALTNKNLISINTVIHGGALSTDTSDYSVLIKKKAAQIVFPNLIFRGGIARAGINASWRYYASTPYGGDVSWLSPQNFNPLPLNILPDGNRGVALLTPSVPWFTGAVVSQHLYGTCSYVRIIMYWDTQFTPTAGTHPSGPPVITYFVNKIVQEFPGADMPLDMQNDSVGVPAVWVAYVPALVTVESLLP